MRNRDSGGDFMGSQTRFASVGAFPFVISALLGLGCLPRTASAQTYLYNRADFATGNQPSAVVAGDFNGDGKPDLAVANRDNTVSILLGNPDGTLGAHVDYAIALGSTALVAADVNGDGKLDLAVAPWGWVPVPAPGIGRRFDPSRQW
jgi:hypothetical protein